jgi:hypothetical protein
MQRFEKELVQIHILQNVRKFLETGGLHSEI